MKITAGKVIAWFWPLPSFGWDALALVDKLKVFAFFIQAGAGIAMTAFASYGMYVLAKAGAVWPVFYLAAMAMVLIGIVITGLAGLLIKRSVEVEAAGGLFKLKAADSDTAAALAPAMQALAETNAGQGPSPTK
jgi:hypothetical protein